MTDGQRREDAREIDRLAREGGKSEWVQGSDSAAGDPMTDDELRGLNVLAQSDPRGDGSIAGVSDANPGDVSATPTIVAPEGAVRRNPPLVEDAGLGDGGISASGGAAGGA
jgi:hypothetical protein